MQSVSSRIWTHVAESISYDDNHYATGTCVDTSIRRLENFITKSKERLITAARNNTNNSLSNNNT